MTRIFTYTIEEKFEGCKVLDYLKQKGYSKSVLVHLKKTPNGIQKNQKWVYVNERLFLGDILTIYLTESASSSKIPPVEVPLSIVYEDEDILVLNKPAGVPTHPSMYQHEYTLANAVANYYYKQGETAFVYRCINRLDKDTSGLTIIAKHMLSAAILGLAVKNREIGREYLAIADGLTKERGTICAPIARKEASVIERTVDFNQGEYALTHYKRLKYENGFSLISLKLETGRTHQIRVHMRHVNHPLIGDFLYHPTNHDMPRQALHARYLTFHHPITRVLLSLEAPVPEDFILEP